MQPLKADAPRVLAGDHHPETSRARREARHIRSLPITRLERQISDSPELAADKRRPEISELATDLHPHDILDTHLWNRVRSAATRRCELSCDMPIALRACTMTPDTPLPEIRMVHTPGSGLATTTMR